jgi:YHS domain-containing protein
MSDAQIARLKAPAGLDIGAATSAEIALSILAEIVQLKYAARAASQREAASAAGITPIAAGAAGGSIATGETRPVPRKSLPMAAPAHAPPAAEAADAGDAPSAAEPTTAIDPVCHMTVTIATARHVGTWGDRTWYFCNPRCKAKFLADPERFLETPSAGAAR